MKLLMDDKKQNNAGEWNPSSRRANSFRAIGTPIREAASRTRPLRSIAGELGLARTKINRSILTPHYEQDNSGGGVRHSQIYITELDGRKTINIRVVVRSRNW